MYGEVIRALAVCAVRCASVSMVLLLILVNSVDEEM